MYLDPFLVLRDYDRYDQAIVALNRDYVSTHLFQKNYSKYLYNSFFFGSSRTISFNSNDWKKHLKKDDSPFKFDAAGENLFGIYKKIKYLDDNGIRLENVVILFCRDAVFKIKNYDGHLTIKHPDVSKESKLSFHLTFFKTYMNIQFLTGYYYYLITKNENSLTKGVIQIDRLTLDERANQIGLGYLDGLIENDKDGYYNSRKEIFYEVENESFEDKPGFEVEHIAMLKEIRTILEKHQSNYKIVLTPLYDQKKFHPEDQKILKSIFGKQLFDFTGHNLITKNKYNWYENDHFRPYIGDSLLKIIYQNPKNK